MIKFQRPEMAHFQRFDCPTSSVLGGPLPAFWVAQFSVLGGPLPAFWAAQFSVLGGPLPAFWAAQFSVLGGPLPAEYAEIPVPSFVIPKTIPPRADQPPNILSNQIRQSAKSLKKSFN